jgi:hypothetical protein
LAALLAVAALLGAQAASTICSAHCGLHTSFTSTGEPLSMDHCATGSGLEMPGLHLDHCPAPSCPVDLLVVAQTKIEFSQMIAVAPIVREFLPSLHPATLSAFPPLPQRSDQGEPPLIAPLRV